MPSTRSRHLLCSFGWLPALCVSVAMQGCGTDDAGGGLVDPSMAPTDASAALGDGGHANPDAASPSSDSGAVHMDSGVRPLDSGAPPPRDAGTDGPSGVTPLGKYVMTWYSFQDNTPVNSAQSASGRALYPYVS